MRAIALALALALLAGLPLAAPPAMASHWCAETTLTLSPPIVTSGVAQVFVISLNNLGSNDTQLTSVSVLFHWESNPRSLGSGSLNAGGSRSFTVTPSSVPAGTHDVTVTFMGTNDNDGPPSLVTTCEATLTVTALGTGGDIFGGFMLILFAVLAIVIIVVVVIVVVVVLASRKKAPPPPPQMPAPPYAPPQFPPPGPPMGPPPTNP